MYVSRTIPFRTAIPKSAMKPTPAEILKGIPLMSEATMPPVASGRLQPLTLSGAWVVQFASGCKALGFLRLLDERLGDLQLLVLTGEKSAQ
jgi:hypothetical protein